MFLYFENMIAEISTSVQGVKENAVMTFWSMEQKAQRVEGMAEKSMARRIDSRVQLYQGEFKKERREENGGEEVRNNSRKFPSTEEKMDTLVESIHEY